MRQRGFTLVEMVLVVAIIGTLLSIGVLQFNAMQKKSAIEQQVRKVYNKLMEARVEALYTKTPRTAVLGGNKLSIYPTTDGSGTPISELPLSYPMVMGGGFDRVTFNAGGVMPISDVDRAICVEPGGVAENSGNTDSVVISAVKIHMGKRKSGEACVPNKIDQK